MVSWAPGENATTRSGDADREHARDRQREARRDHRRHRERPERRSHVAHEHARTSIGEARAGGSAESDHPRARRPPRQHGIDESAAVQHAGADHGAKQQAAGQAEPQHGDGRERGDRDEDRKFRQRAAGRGHCRLGRRRQSEQRQCRRQSDGEQHHANRLHDRDGAQVSAIFDRQRHDLREARRDSRRAARKAHPSHAQTADRTSPPQSCRRSRPRARRC